MKKPITQKCRGCENQCPTGYTLCDDCYFERNNEKKS